MSAFTIFGAGGFVGSALRAALARKGRAVRAIGREDWPAEGEALGHGIFAIGLTADFRQRLDQTIEAHVVALHRALTRYRFESFLYLSSTRVYAGASSTLEEAALSVRPAEPDQLYNISKLAGEALCLARENAAVRVARLSNVYGPGQEPASFLPTVLAEARRAGRVTIRQASTSAKDYVSIDGVIARLVAIAEGGRARIYNVASGRNVSHGEIAAMIGRAGRVAEFEADAPEATFPPIDCRRAEAEFGPIPDELEAHVASELAPAGAQGAGA